MAKNTGRGSRAAAADPGGFPWMRLHGGSFGDIPAGCWRAHRAGRACQHETRHPVGCYCAGFESDLTCSTRWAGRVGTTPARNPWQPTGEIAMLRACVRGYCAAAGILLTAAVVRVARGPRS